MISFEKKKSDLPQPVAGEAEQNRFERIRKLAAEKHRKGDGTPRRDRQAAEDDRLIWLTTRRRPRAGVVTRSTAQASQARDARCDKRCSHPRAAFSYPGSSPPDALPAPLGSNSECKTRPPIFRNSSEPGAKTEPVHFASKALLRATEK